MRSDEIRDLFLSFFKEKNHRVVSSDLLVPRNDPSVLFTSAGMSQFKEQFMGNVTDYRRAASVQKCLRTGDLENVGRSPTHHTFFEMLGNFSFGDYFKAEAIAWAWEFITDRLKLPVERLWISVHHQDEEAYRIWRQDIGIDAGRLVQLGDADNFWPANAPTDGPNGPCGPCSEIYYDWGVAYGCGNPACNPACDCKRFSEIWNLVFTQFNRQPDGSLPPLPSKNIDTGMGLERLTAVLQGHRDNFSTDLFAPIISTLVEELARSGASAPEGWFPDRRVGQTGPAPEVKTIVDHLRAATFAIGDGVIPSNEAQGYVIRKLIRRSIMLLKQAGVTGPFCYKLVYAVCDKMKNPYEELFKRHEVVAGMIKKEEEMFWKILYERAPYTDAEFKKLSGGIPASGDAADVHAEAARIAFVQYDTYGVPLEISKECAAKYGLLIDDEAFEAEMDKQRERSRGKTQLAANIFGHTAGVHLRGMKTEFVGYEHLESSATVLLLLKNQQPVEESAAGETVQVVLDRTPFYAESGGQAADRGILSCASMQAAVGDVQKNEESIIHVVTVQNGVLRKGDVVEARVDSEMRFDTARNHTATHLLQAVLRKQLGTHVEQSGSSVGPDKLRFDFSHPAAIGPELLRRIEDDIQQLIWRNIPVSTRQMGVAEAKQQGALAFFGEKYGEQVRMLTIGEHSRELCGGTHVSVTGNIGLFRIVAETSVAQGIRRIEAVTGRRALERIRRQDDILHAVALLVKTGPEQTPEAVERVLQQVKSLEKELKQYKMKAVSANTQGAAREPVPMGAAQVVIGSVPGADAAMLRSLWDTVKTRYEQGMGVLVSVDVPKPLLIVGVTPGLQSRGIDAVAVLKRITAKTGGGGGGKKELAQAGVPSNDAAQLVVSVAEPVLREYLQEMGVMG